MEKAKIILQKRHSHVKSYNVEHEMAIMAATIAQQKAWELEMGNSGPLAMLTGLNLKRFLIGAWPKVNDPDLVLHID